MRKNTVKLTIMCFVFLLIGHSVRSRSNHNQGNSANALYSPVSKSNNLNNLKVSNPATAAKNNSQTSFSINKPSRNNLSSKFSIFTRKPSAAKSSKNTPSAATPPVVNRAAKSPQIKEAFKPQASSENPYASLNFEKSTSTASSNNLYEYGNKPASSVKTGDQVYSQVKKDGPVVKPADPVYATIEESTGGKRASFSTNATKSEPIYAEPIYAETGKPLVSMKNRPLPEIPVENSAINSNPVYEEIGKPSVSLNSPVIKAKSNTTYEAWKPLEGTRLPDSSVANPLYAQAPVKLPEPLLTNARPIKVKDANHYESMDSAGMKKLLKENENINELTDRLKLLERQLDGTSNPKGRAATQMQIVEVQEKLGALGASRTAVVKEVATPNALTSSAAN